MWNVCPACGMYAVEKEIQPGSGWRAKAVCPRCGNSHPFLRLPLFLVTGASGTGKSTLALSAAGHIPGFVHLEMDILWGPAFDQPAEDYQPFRSAWLRLAKNIQQAGQPVVLYGSGVPAQFEGNPERRYFQQLHVLALVCQPHVLEARLRARPDWRESSGEGFVTSMLQFNRWFLENAASTDPAMTLLDTSTLTLEQTLAELHAWLENHWKMEMF